MHKVHIVHAHPEPRSFCTAMARQAQSLFAQQGCEVWFSDLYADGFDPVAKAGDFGARADPDYLVYALEQRHGYAHGTLAPDIQREVRRLLLCDTLVLVFPLYWFSVPAMLKGWIDRCFLSGPLYGGKRIYGRAPMAGKRAVVAATLGGREHMFGPDAVHGELATGMLRHLLQGTLGYVGFDVLQPFFGWHVPYCTPDQRAQTMARWADYLQALDAQPRLPMPDLSRYDDLFRPLSAAATSTTE
ncbi:MAG: NAD(P)H-dependent oxidoreductase [Pseudomonadota bacterium]